ncbi:MAG TPA: V-type ATP synthase subunit E family protein [Thermoplasmata archaeon]|nr:V-type ATP synthase subunit E family protein [Thermoplasmata archaeon]
MSLENLVEEIRRRADDELRAEQARLAQETARITSDREARVAEIRSTAQHHAQLEATRERAQRIAAARLGARKLAYEAKERQMGDALAQSRALLKAYTADPEYPQALKRMVAFATDQLGKTLKIYGRSEDAALLKTAAGKSFDDRSAAILGGLIAETADGNRRLNLSFDELLRLREDRLRDLLAK